MNTMQQQPWLHSARFDLALIVGPGLIVTALVVALYPWWHSLSATPIWLWGLLIVGIDASHVYSTLFRTYFDQTELRTRPSLYIGVPIAAWVVGTMLYSIDSTAFWRVLAYLAVFHFVRQQYGLMMIYSRGGKNAPHWARRIDQLAIYLATLYPLVWWHCEPRAFEWFIKNDFISVASSWPSDVVGAAYAATLIAYVGKEVALLRAGLPFNLPRNLLLVSTAASWWVGIVAFDSDIAFTAINVVSHGIPYMALIWLYRRNASTLERVAVPNAANWTTAWLKPRRWPCYLVCLVLLAYVEESLWDGLVWQEHPSLFSLAATLPAIEQASALTWLVPLLAIPQATHYVLDAFIWRLREPETIWKQVLFLRDSPREDVAR